MAYVVSFLYLSVVKMKKFNILLLIILFGKTYGQAYINNPDFELYTNCPATYGDFANKISSWVSVVDNPDYYKCTFYDTTAAPTNTVAYSGTGYVGFGTYGDSNGSSEAIGQTLNQSFLPGITYSISFAAKKARSGISSQNCGGVELYGIKSTLYSSLSYTHISQVPNTFFLGKTLTVQNTNWQVFSFNFTPSDTMKHIVLTLEKIPNCYQYVYIDALNSNTLLGLNEIVKNNSIKIYPNPLKNSLYIKTELNDFENSEIEIINYLGQAVLKTPFSNSIDVSKLASGIYNLKISSENREIYYSKFVKE